MRTLPGWALLVRALLQQSWLWSPVRSLGPARVLLLPGHCCTSLHLMSHPLSTPPHWEPVDDELVAQTGAVQRSNHNRGLSQMNGPFMKSLCPPSVRWASVKGSPEGEGKKALPPTGPCSCQWTAAPEGETRWGRRGSFFPLPRGWVGLQQRTETGTN